MVLLSCFDLPSVCPWLFLLRSTTWLPTKHCFRKNSVDATLSPVVGADRDTFYNWYGHFWMAMRENRTEINGDMWCVSGFWFQTACLNYETNRVVVNQRSNTVYDLEFLDDNVLWDAFNTNFTCEGPPTVSPAPTEVPGSSSSRSGANVFGFARGF